MESLITPHGGGLIDLLVEEDRARELTRTSRDLPSWDLAPRQLCDLELLTTGAFSPLAGFMSRGDYEAVCRDMRLADGTLWPIPVVLDVPEELAERLRPGDGLALRDPEGVMLAVLWAEDVWWPNRRLEAELIYGTTDPAHPGVRSLLEATHPCSVGGRVEAVRLPVHHDFRDIRLSPRDVRAHIARLGYERVVAFQTRNPLHRAHQQLTLRAAREADAHLLIHPVVGATKPGDIDHYTRVRCYQEVLRHYQPGNASLALLPLAMRMAGPREALWHAIVRKNFGCTHFIIGRDHAGPGADGDGRPFYDPYAAQELVRAHEEELGIHMVPFRQMVYAEDLDAYLPEDEVPPGSRTLHVAGTELRRLLAQGAEVPPWFSFPEVVAELRRTHPPRDRRGFTLFLTGLSGAGKSTIASVLLARFLERGGRPVTLLDGDVVRKHLSSELGFSKEHRDINIRRVGFVASEITKNGGIAICAPIAPYDAVRRDVREMIEPLGGFVLVYVSTPLAVCEERDRKGLYAKARAGLLPNFTGVSDPYETPADAEVVIDTTRLDAEEAADAILRYLGGEGYVAAASGDRGAEDRWVRSEAVLSRRISDGLMLLPLGDGEPFVLGGSGPAFWELLAEPIALEEASRALAEAYGVPVAAVASDIAPVLHELARREAIRRV